LLPLLDECLTKLRPDLTRLEIIGNLDADSMSKFLCKHGAQFEQISILKYQWTEDRSEAVSEYIRKAKIKRIELMNVNDVAKAISGILEAVVQNRYIREFRMPINGIGADEAIYIYKMIEENQGALEEIDLSFEVVQE
jgi:hypothetical protein